MLNDEMLKRLSESPVASELEEKQRIREQLAKDTERFLAKNGIITVIKQGVTSEFPDASIPIPIKKGFKAAHDKLAKRRITVTRRRV